MNESLIIEGAGHGAHLSIEMHAIDEQPPPNDH